MSRPELFGDRPETAGREAKGRGKARMQSPVRDQLGWQTVDLDSLLEAGHPVRVIWSYVAGLDRGARAYGWPGTGRSAPDAGTLAVRDGGRGWQRAGFGAAVREPCGLSLAVRRGERQLPRPGGLPDGARRGSGRPSGAVGGRIGAGRGGQPARGGAGRGAGAGARGGGRRFVPAQEQPA